LFILQYTNELNEDISVEKTGNYYSRDFYLNELTRKFFCMLFVNNKEYNENEYAIISLEKNNKILEEKRFHISNMNPYDGWFIFEK